MNRSLKALNTLTELSLRLARITSASFVNASFGHCSTVVCSQATRGALRNLPRPSLSVFGDKLRRRERAEIGERVAQARMVPVPPRKREQILRDVFGKAQAQSCCWHACHDREGGDVFGYHRASGHDGPDTDTHLGLDDRTMPDPAISAQRGSTRGALSEKSFQSGSS